MPTHRPRIPRPLLPTLLILLTAWAAAVLALDPSKDFHHYVRDTWSIEQGLPQISALAITQDRQGYLWVGTQAGLARFDGNRFVPFTPESTPEIPGSYIHDLMYDGRDRLWAATYKGLAVLEDGRWSTVPLQAGAAELEPAVVALAETATGEVLAAIGDAVFAVEDGMLRVRHRLTRPAHGLLVSGDTLLVGSRGGVYRLAADGGSVFLALPDDADSAAVTQLIEAQGKLWAGTSQGLFHREGDAGWQRFTDDESLARAPIEAMREDRDGNLWVAELARMVRLRDGKMFEHVELQGIVLSVRAIFEDREGNLWLGSQWNGLTRLRNGWTRRYTLREGLHTPLLWSVAEGREGELWIGTDDGLSRFRDGRFEQVVPGSELPHPNAYTLLVEDDAIWIGTRRGLAVLRDGRLQRPRAFAAMRSAQINGILRTRDGVLWFATTTGLYRQAGAELERFAEAEGLADVRVRYIIERRDGRLMLGTHSGLYEFVDDRLVARGRDEGLPDGLDITAMHELEDGQLVIGTISEEVFLHDGSRWTRFGTEQGMPANAPFFLASDARYLWVAGIRGVQRAPLADMFQVAAGRESRINAHQLLNERGDRRGGQKGYCCNGAGIAKGLLRDGQLWAPTRDGLVALDTADVRFASKPPTTLVERLRVSGQWRDAADSGDAVLPAAARDLGFEFTAISFEDPRSVGFRYRLLGYHDDWREPDEPSQRVVSYTNLPPGAYRFEVQGSTIAGRWSEPASLEFSIQPYFRETGGFVALLALFALLLAFLGYRLQRRRYKKRALVLEQLVQQRTEALAEANQRLQEASQTDPLTGLRNRRYLALQIPKDLAFYSRELRAGTALGQVIVFAIVDIDHFKRINDEHGHGAGDRVLEQFAEVLLRLVRTGDYVARWGGEEFVLVFRPTQSDHLPLLGERIRAAAADHAFDIGAEEPLRLTCSIGLVEHPLFSDDQNALSWEQLIELADRALYHVKRNGRNGWAAYRPAPGVSVGRVLELLRLDEAAFQRSTDLQLVGSRPGNGPAGPAPTH